MSESPQADQEYRVLPPYSGDMLRRMREHRGLTQVEVAGSLQRSSSTVSRWERASEVPLSRAIIYARALGGRLSVVAVHQETGEQVPLI